MSPWWLLCGAAAAPYHSDVTLPSLEIRTLTTEHFAIHFVERDRAGRPVGSRPYAEALAAVADDLLRDMAHALDARVPRGRLHVLVLDRQDELEGYTLPHWDWIVLSAHPGSQLGRSRGRSDLARDALAHELGHVLTHKQATTLPEALNYGLTIGGMAEGAGGGVGWSVEFDHDRPYGWSEGLAELASELAGVNHWTTERRARLRAAARDDRLLTWDELQVATDKDRGDHELAYQQGYAFARWLDGARPGVWTEVARVRRRRGWPSWTRLLSDVLGEDVRAVHERFLGDMRARAAEDDARVVARGVVEGEELIPWRPMWRTEASWAEDAWAEMTPREREEAREATGAWRLCPAHDGTWLADGRVGWVVVQAVDEGRLPGASGAWPDDDAPDAGASLWVPARFGRSFAFVPGEDALVVIAPTDDVRRPAIDDGFDLDQAFRVELPRADGRGQHGPVRRRMAPIPGTERAMDVAVSPSGGTLAFLRFVGGGQELVVGPIDGSAWRVLDRWGPESSAQGLTWSPDGTRLATSAMRGGMLDLWSIEVADGGWTALTRDRWQEQDPHWTEDGLLFTADLDGVQDVFRLDAGRVQRLTSHRDGAICPSLTPGGQLLFSSPTSAGVKSMGLARGHAHGADVTERFELAPDPERQRAALEAAPHIHDAVESRYRPLRSMLPPSWGPYARVDVSGAEVSPALGAFGSLGDAVERHDLSWWVRVGDDLAGEAQYVAHTMWPELGMWARGVQARRVVPEQGQDLRSLLVGGVFLRRALSDQLTLGAEWQGVQLDRSPGRAEVERLRGQRATVEATVGALGDDLDAEGVSMDVGLTVGWSRHEGTTSLGATGWDDDGEQLGDIVWARPWLDGRLHTAIGPRGRLRDAPHRLEVRLAGGTTSRSVALEEELAAGGETPGAVRLTALETSWSLPGYAPYQLHGESVVVGGMAWAWPIAPRARRLVGAWSFRRLEWVTGGDVGASWSWANAVAPSLADARLGADLRVALRVASALRDTPLNSQLLVAWPLAADPQRAPRRGEVPMASSWTEPRRIRPRILLGFGTGW